jgi:hypothetical protein
MRGALEEDVKVVDVLPVVSVKAVVEEEARDGGY